MRYLLAIDLQKQFADTEGKYAECLAFVNNYRITYDAVIATVFSQNVNGVCNENFKKHLGWEGCNTCSDEDLEFEADRVIIKNGYSSDAIYAAIPSGAEVDVIGCDTDACLMAVCFGLWDRQYTFRILKNYTYTTASELSNEAVLTIMRRNFGDCVQ